MIGILGGAFDPVHFGHLRTALEVREALGLDEVRLLPLNVAVHREQPAADGALRLRMLEAAVANAPGLVADDRELTRPGGSYTVDTLTHLRDELGADVRLCLLVGGDAFNGFLAWHRPRDILGLAHLAVMRRPGSVLPRDPELREELERRRAARPADLHAAPAGRIWLQSVTQLDISSTRIRRTMAAGHSPRFLLPDAVLDIALAAGCYAGPQDPTATGEPAPGRREETHSDTSAQRGHDAA
ncbi:MAG: nicotinate-nucleotide adenylyltransferase [Thiohalocapsa sp.]|jgi:nicotinate-nucleotide adenylyltransferase|uniref:nicotinate-nucleotide adenylyltransferase n=1 Tax=Thiohalocapsa sp. TaxID=2497641 RepID=UPI0025EDC6D0|nr:nicotinate-nucleotide adenylyltransferase [Thiohalocapsa sp.]MCG6943353.1 nicotinate-nucleotide adenylyltransferase [Thiohalocapsa sp.]